MASLAMRPFSLVALAVAAVATAALCPPTGSSVTTDTYAVGCAGLQLTVDADDVTLVIEGATGSLSVTSNVSGTTLRLLDSNVAGNLTLSGSNASADVRRSRVTGADVVSLASTRNATIIVIDSTLTGSVIASVLSGAIGVSIKISNSTLNATRYAASVVGDTIRDVVVMVADSRLALTGGDNVGIVALAAANVFNAVINVTASSITSTAGNGAWVLGTGGIYDGTVNWTNVTVSAAGVNVTSTADDRVGVLGAGSGAVKWTYVTVSAALVNVKSTAGFFVGVLGAGSTVVVNWTNVAISATVANVTSTAGSYVGLLGAGTYNCTVDWTNVTVCATLANVTSTADSYVGVLGAASSNAGSYSGSASWMNVTVSAALATVMSTATSFVGVIGTGNYNRDVNWTNVTVSAALANVTSTARFGVGILGAGSYVDVAVDETAAATWADVAVVLTDSTVACRQSDGVGVLGASIVTRDSMTFNPTANGSVTWRRVVVVAAASRVSVWASQRAAVLGASADRGAWDGVFVGAVEASIVFARVGPVGFTLGAPGAWRDVVLANGSASIDSNRSVLCSNRTLEVCAAADVASLIDSARLKTAATTSSSQMDTASQTTTASTASQTTTTATACQTTTTATTNLTTTSTASQTTTSPTASQSASTATASQSTSTATASPTTTAMSLLLNGTAKLPDGVAVSVAANVSITVAFVASFVSVGGVSLAQRAASVLAALRCPEGVIEPPSAWQHPIGVSLRAGSTEAASLYASAAVVDVFLWLPLSIVAVAGLNIASWTDCTSKASVAWHRLVGSCSLPACLRVCCCLLRGFSGARSSPRRLLSPRASMCLRSRCYRWCRYFRS